VADEQQFPNNFAPLSSLLHTSLSSPKQSSKHKTPQPSSTTHHHFHAPSGFSNFPACLSSHILLHTKWLFLAPLSVFIHLTKTDLSFTNTHLTTHLDAAPHCFTISLKIGIRWIGAVFSVVLAYTAYTDIISHGIKFSTTYTI